MRRDLHKVITTRPRGNSKHKKNATVRYIRRRSRNMVNRLTEITEQHKDDSCWRDFSEENDYDICPGCPDCEWVETYYDLVDNVVPQKVSMRGRLRRSDSVDLQFTDLINPLYRWLRSRRDQQWDDVWSALCRTEWNDLHEWHLKIHINGLVAQNCYEDEDGYFRDNTGVRPWARFVVIDGILRENPRNWSNGWRRESNLPYDDMVPVSSTCAVLKHKGLWFKVDVKEPGPKEPQLYTDSWWAWRADRYTRRIPEFIKDHPLWTAYLKSGDHYERFRQLARENGVTYRQLSTKDAMDFKEKFKY